MSEDINFVKSVYFCEMETPPGNENFRQMNIMESLPERQLETRIYDRLCLKY